MIAAVVLLIALRSIIQNRVVRLAVLDVLTIADARDRADRRMTAQQAGLGRYWLQPEPLPERLISAASPMLLVGNALGGWGSSAATFDSGIRAAYIDALRDPEHVHAICEAIRN